MARIEGGNVTICDVSVEGGVKKVVEGVRRFGLSSKDIGLADRVDIEGGYAGRRSDRESGRRMGFVVRINGVSGF
jgi:hypothetical protein